MTPLLLFFLAAAPVLRVTSTTVVSTDPLVSYSAVFSQDGSRLAYLSNGHLFVMDVASRITRDCGIWVRAGEMLAFAPDGRSMYFGDKTTLYLRSIEGPDDRRKILEKVRFGPKVSPDGKTLSFGRAEGRSTVLLLANPDGSHERRLAVLSPYSANWTWSADSSAIAVLTWRMEDRRTFKNILSVISTQPPSALHQIAEWEGDSGALLWPDVNGILVDRRDGLWYFSTADQQWSMVQDAAGLTAFRPAGPDGWTIAAARHRKSQTFWDSLWRVVGVDNGRVEDHLLLLHITK